MQLVQLSDIHVGSFFKQQVFDTVVEEVNKLNLYPSAAAAVLSQYHVLLLYANDTNNLHLYRYAYVL